ncbi:MAG: hypothetical protein QOD98_1596 [Nocardioidaceae bacterium]|nr:hypothetical protein [Nocardioidaceae bacterium]
MVLAALVCVPGASTAPAIPADEPVRILIIGDSMTQGSSGDWTYRYRLWKYLQASGTHVEFVGPRDDLLEPLSGAFGSHDYIDPDFDQNHAARWGLSMAFPDEGESISELMTDFQPDVVVEMLGVNDLTWLQGNPEQLVHLTRNFVANARAVDPDVDLVLSRIPQPWWEQVVTFNDLLDGVADDLDTPGSRVVSAQSDVDIVRADDTWDTFHPNSHGELKIAAHLADSLASIGVGTPAPRPLPLSDIPLGPRLPTVLTATPIVRGASLTWVRSPGANEAQVWLRDVTAAEDWHLVAEHVTGTAQELDNLPGWHRVEVQVAPIKGSWRAEHDAWSNVVSLEVPDDHLARGTAPAVSAASDGHVTLSWAAVPGATSYAVQWRRTDQPDGRLGTATVDSTSTAVSGLVNRTGYAFRVRAVRGVMAGDWSDETTAVVPPLAAVRGAQVRRSHGALKSSARTVALATSYTLRAAPSASCGHPPRAGRFDVVAAGLSSPRTRFRLEADAVWVRWVAVRGGVEGNLAPSSTACVKLPR